MKGELFYQLLTNGNIHHSLSKLFFFPWKPLEPENTTFPGLSSSYIPFTKSSLGKKMKTGRDDLGREIAKWTAMPFTFPATIPPKER